MHPLHFTAETSSNGLVERDFTMGKVTGVLWSPASGAGRAPLVLMGHGGGQHSRAPAMAGRAHRIVTGDLLAGAARRITIPVEFDLQWTTSTSTASPAWRC